MASAAFQSMTTSLAGSPAAVPAPGRRAAGLQGQKQATFLGSGAAPLWPARAGRGAAKWTASVGNDPAKMPMEMAQKLGNTVKTLAGEAISGEFPRLGKNGKPLLTDNAGHPIPDDNNSMTIGDSGQLLMEDYHLINKLARFNRERVPERVVHAKGAGAHGYFEVTQDISDICRASLFSGRGKRTPVFARFSTVTGERGFADTARDVRGFSLKFYTEEGIWDMVGNNTPVFWVRDPIKFPDLIHSQKRHPQTNLRHPDSFWDFLSLVPESLHQTLITFSPRGVPDGFRYMHGYGSHTFKMVNDDGKASWVKFHFQCDQGVKNMPYKQAQEWAGLDPDYATRDLAEAIARGDHPSWTFYLQVMSPEQANELKFDPFDLTKVWSHKEFPLREVGKLVIDRNPVNYFAEVEQVSFSPGRMPPGIEPSPDRILQSRLFAYDDAARYRVGANVMQVPINTCPFAKAQTYERDGPMNTTNNGSSEPNYYPNSFPHLPQPDPSQTDRFPYHHEGGQVGRGISSRWSPDDVYEQPRALWQLMSEEDKRLTLTAIANHMGQAQQSIQVRQIDNFRKVSPDLAEGLEEMLQVLKKSGDPETVIA